MRTKVAFHAMVVAAPDASSLRRAALVTLALCGLGVSASCDSSDGTGATPATETDGTTLQGASSSTQGTSSTTTAGFGASCGQPSCSADGNATANGASSDGSGGQPTTTTQPNPYSTSATGFGGSSPGHGGAPTCSGREESGAAGACSTGGSEVPALGVDMYVMLDHTLSMENEIGDGGATRWELTRTSIREFVQRLKEDPPALEVGVGVQLFSWVNDADCAFDRFANPDVEIGSVDANSDAIDALLDEEPVGQTPTYPALIGALDYAREWANAHPDRHTVIVFITDGDANRCSPIDPGAIALQASGALQALPRIPVHFVGIDGSYGLDPVADAAGTGEVTQIMLRDSLSQSVDDFVDTLEDIAQPWQPCEFDIPEGSQDFAGLQVSYQDESGDVFSVDWLSGAGECVNSTFGGFFFSDWGLSGEPSRASLCPCTCSAVQGTSVELRPACQASFP